MKSSLNPGCWTCRRQLLDHLYCLHSTVQQSLNRLSRNRLLSQVTITDCYTAFNWLTKKFNQFNLNRLLQRTLQQVPKCKSQAYFHKSLILNTFELYFFSFLDPLIFSLFFLNPYQSFQSVWALKFSLKKNYAKNASKDYQPHIHISRLGL